MIQIHAQPGDAVLDTNIYYKSPKRVKEWLDGQGLQPAFSPNNALELVTPPVGDRGKEFEKRKQAAKNLLDLTNQGQRIVPDSELVHASLLGYDIVPSDNWVEGVKRFLTLPDATPASWNAAALDLQPAIDAIDAAYKAYISKIETALNAYNKVWRDNKVQLKEKGISHEVFKDVEMARSVVEALGVPDQVITAHIDRICTTAKQLRLSGALIKDDDRAASVALYVRAYIGHLLFALSTEKRDKNDFGDLQFFAYCDAGYKLVGAEKRWQIIVAQEGLSEWLIAFPPDEVATPQTS